MNARAKYEISFPVQLTTIQFNEVHFEWYSLVIN